MPLKYDAESCRNGIYVKFYIDIVPQHFFSIELLSTGECIEDDMSPQKQVLGKDRIGQDRRIG